MKKCIFLILLALIMIFCSCAINSRGVTITNKPQVSDIQVLSTEAVITPSAADTPGASKASYPPGSNTEIISSILKRMIINKKTNSVEGFTDKSTYRDVLDKIGEGNIESAFLSYNSEFLGYPVVMKCIFGNSGDGKLSLGWLNYLIILNQKRGYEEQLQNLVDGLKTKFGNSPEGEYPYFRWKGDTYGVYVETNENYKASGMLATVSVISSDKSEMPDIFPYKFGTNIYTVYQNEKPDPKLETIVDDPYAYYIWYYGDKDTIVKFCFLVDGSEIKLSNAEYEINLLNTGFGDIEKCFKSFGDNMENILGPALSRDSDSEHYSSVYSPVLVMKWKELSISAYVMDDAPCIDLDFSKEFFENN